MSTRTQDIAVRALRPPPPSAEVLFGHMNLPDHLRPDFIFLAWNWPREKFLKLISTEHREGSAEYDLVAKAFDTSLRWHGSRPRNSGESEFEHCLRCTLTLWIYRGVRNANRIAGMLLHDLTETFQAAWPIRRIVREFNNQVARYVGGLTKLPKTRGRSKREVERIFYRGLESAPMEIVEQKAIDVLENLLTLWRRRPERMRQKIRDVKKYLLPILEKFPELVELLETIKVVLEFITEKLNRGDTFAY